MQEGGAAREAFPLVRGGRSEDLMLNAYKADAGESRKHSKPSSFSQITMNFFEQDIVIVARFPVSASPAATSTEKRKQTYPRGR